jgi:hypothetical protein
MPNSRRRKRRAKPQEKQTAPAARRAVPLHRLPSLNWSSLRRAVSKVAGLIAFLAAAYGFWDAYVLSAPEIHVTAPESPKPFLLPFSIRNDSTLFWIRDGQWSCVVKRGDFGSVVFDNTTIQRNARTAIAPRQTVRYSCPIAQDAMPKGLLIVEIAVDFTTLFWRRSHRELFTWSKGHWLEGEAVP